MFQVSLIWLLLTTFYLDEKFIGISRIVQDLWCQQSIEQIVNAIAILVIQAFNL